MINMKLKNCNDILDYLLFLERKAASLEEELDSLKYSFFNRKAKERKKTIKGDLKKIYEMLEEYDDFLYDATTFKREDLDVFFVKYFTALYGIEYTVEENAKDKSEGSYWTPTDIIASKRDFARIDKKYNFTRKVNVDDIIDMCQDSCLCIGGPEEYTLLEGTMLSPELKGFPEIAEVVKILVDLKLSDPNLSDKKRLAICLKIAVSRLNKKPESTYSQPEPTDSTHVSKPIEPKAPVSSGKHIFDNVTPKAASAPVSKPLRVASSESFSPIAEQSSQTISGASRQNPQTSHESEKVLTKSLMGKYLHHK